MDEATLADRLARIESTLDELVRLNRERGQDHENRLRALEAQANGFVTKKAAYASLVIICTVVSVVTNFLAQVMG